MPARRPGNRNRENAYAAVQARNTPRPWWPPPRCAVMIQVRNGCSVSTSTKFWSEKVSGQASRPEGGP